MSASLDQIHRAEKAAISKALHARLSARFTRGPAEPELDDYIPQLADVARRLAVPPNNPVSEEAERARRIAAVVSADDEVDTYLRHIEGYLTVEALRRTGPNGGAARALHDAAFPDGLAHIDDRIVEENFHCRASLAILKAPERAATLAALELPREWLVRWEAALDASDAAISEVLRTMAAKDAGAPPAPRARPCAAAPGGRRGRLGRADGPPAPLRHRPRGARRRAADRGGAGAAPAALRRAAEAADEHHVALDARALVRARAHAHAASRVPTGLRGRAAARGSSRAAQRPSRRRACSCRRPAYRRPAWARAGADAWAAAWAGDPLPLKSMISLDTQR